jgi:hypothetical protein
VIADLTEMAERSVQRYDGFLASLRGEADLLFRRGAVAEALRDEIFYRSLELARGFSAREQAELNDDAQKIAIAAHERALSDLGARSETIADRFAEFIFSAALYSARLIAAQAERDVMNLSQHVSTNSMRVDLYVRSGRHTPSSAAAAVMLEDSEAPAFNFIDRVGRRYKSTKHIRDIYRASLLNIYNEVYMDVAVSAGHDSIFVQHPDPSFKWHGAELLVVSGAEGLPLYYDVKDEIFHPSSNATVTIVNPGA